ncbi:MAG: phosphoesterase PA-phosphatase related protein [Myxococcales bacterium]|nr:phosphoesterase PA-phosphatase related protein [Myxococcales bacterium]
MRPRVLVALVAVASLAAPAAADSDVIPGHSVDAPVDGAIQAIALGGTLGFSLIPVRDSDARWNDELFEVDLRVRTQFSRRAAHISDALLVSSMAAPAIYLTGSTIDDADGDRLLLYGQSMAVNMLLAQATKRLVQRPRPYMYSKDPAVQRYAKSEGDDGHMSFYSGHASLSFGAATTGAYLLGASSTSGAARGVAWGLGMAAAAGAATFRVRAGKHFYSDVVVGAVVGITVGYLVPALHADGEPYTPSGQEIAAAGAGILGGMLVANLIPLEKRAKEDGDPGALAMLSRLTIGPVPVENGIGFAVGGAM